MNDPLKLPSPSHPRKSQIPLVPKPLLDALEALYPPLDNIPSEEFRRLDHGQIHHLFGARSVVVLLRRQYELQQEE